MNTFVCFITLVIPNQIDLFLGKLVFDYDFAVEKAADKDGKLYLNTADCPSTLLCINVSTKNKDLSLIKIRTNIAACLKSLQISYLSLIVLDSTLGTCCWSIGEVFYSRPKSKKNHNSSTQNIVQLSKIKDEQFPDGIIEDK